MGDEPVKARLKSLVRALDPAAAPHLPVLTPVTSYAHIDGLSPPQEGPGTSKSKGKKKKNRSKNNSNGNKGNNSNQGNSGKKSGNAHGSNQNSTNASNAKAGNNKKAAPRQPKPDLSVASFPALSSDNSPKVEVVVDGGMETGPKASSTSDSASTTTTLSSSSSSVTKGSQAVSGGYAAALRKSKPASAPVAASTAPKVCKTLPLHPFDGVLF